MISVNPNGSVWAIEGITSPDGRVLGKMGHLSAQVPACTATFRAYTGRPVQPLIEGGVDYFA